MDQIQAMRIFTRIVELGSFSRAAERLQLPRATVSNALKWLEQRLGVRLLIRTTRQVQVTSEGTLYYQRCVQLLGALEEADTLFSHHKLQPSGKVRIDINQRFSLAEAAKAQTELSGRRTTGSTILLP